MLDGRIDDVERSALESNGARPVFPGYTPHAVSPPGLVPTGVVLDGSEDDRFWSMNENVIRDLVKRSSSQSEVRREIFNRQYNVHYWKFCSGSHDNFAARINYFLYRCQPYQALAQIIACIEVRERQQDGYRADEKTDTDGFRSHTHEIFLIYNLLIALKGMLKLAHPSAVFVGFRRGVFAVSTDPVYLPLALAYNTKLKEYDSKQSLIAAKAAAPPGTKAIGKKGDSKQRFSLDDIGGRRRTFRRKNGRRRTQKKRKTYV